MRCGRSNGRLTAHPVEQFALTSQMPIVWRLQAPLAFAIDEFEPLSQPRIVGQVILPTEMAVIPSMRYALRTSLS